MFSLSEPSFLICKVLPLLGSRELSEANVHEGSRLVAGTQSASPYHESFRLLFPSKQRED